MSYGPVISPHNLYLLFDGDSIVIDFGDRTECFMFNKQNHFTEQKLSDNNLYILTQDDYANATPKP